MSNNHSTGSTPPVNTLKRHPLSMIWRDIPDDEFDTLKEGIRRRGLQHPNNVITLFEGLVLDGWHRYTACRELDLLDALDVYEFDGPDPVAYVVNMNATRRHLTAGQRATMTALAYCSQWASGGRPRNPAPGAGFSEDHPVTTQKMAETAGVSERTMRQGQRVVRAGKEEEVLSGSRSLKEADASLGPPPPPPSKASPALPPKPKPPADLEDDTTQEELAALGKQVELEEVERLRRENAILTASRDRHQQQYYDLSVYVQKIEHQNQRFRKELIRLRSP